ncbi:tripartite tricarboxylate transporter substrate binding protein [Ramlibacter henchirensis]|uniref:Tripartite tricarboxylate transporter substrate binding protein n=1 Tax=Ramlibacter henchirensis TaxID=204072 RepID=A0A4Z0C502_9BURK|nr:tripartite tricarboxylate transporter substrate binding protein [Ramlibacter henchirensis]TFZ05448.1 tripartite tricarboxylate transporter substrate binding protein [Ramlibacter henchirensis]
MKFGKFVVAAFAALACTGAAFAQDYPSRQVTMVVGYPPGGAVDAVGRLIAQRLGESLGKPVVVDNKSGASGNIGAQFVAKAPPDGHTLLVAPLTSYAMNSLLLPATTGYQLDKDFAPVSLVGYLPLVLMANEAVPASTPAQLVAIAKAKPASLNYASSGNGSIEHVAGEMFKRQASVSLLHIPYRGAAPAMTDLLAGQVQVMFATSATAMANMKTGRIKPLMVATPQRISALPDVPTAREAGFAGFEVASTYAVLAPAGTPPAVVRRLNQEISKIMQVQEVRQRFQTLGIETMTSTPEEAGARVTAELSKWGQVIKAANIKAD